MLSRAIWALFLSILMFCSLDPFFFFFGGGGGSAPVAPPPPPPPLDPPLEYYPCTTITRLNALNHLKSLKPAHAQYWENKFIENKLESQLLDVLQCGHNHYQTLRRFCSFLKTILIRQLTKWISECGFIIIINQFLCSANVTLLEIGRYRSLLSWFKMYRSTYIQKP